MQIIYCQGKTNVCADFLSRYVDDDSNECVLDRATVYSVSTAVPPIQKITDAQQSETPPLGRSYHKKNEIIYHGYKIWVPPKIQVDVAIYVRACLSCQRLRFGTECLQDFITSHPVDGPFRRVHMDIYEFTIDNKPYKCLTMKDNHIKVEVKLINDNSAQTLTEMFVKK